MLIKSSNNNSQIKVIDIRANELQPGLLNILSGHVNEDVDNCLTTHVVSEQGVRRAILSSFEVPKITGEVLTEDNSIIISNDINNTITFKSLLFSGDVNGALMSDISGTTILGTNKTFYAGERGEYDTLIKNYGKTYEISRITPFDLVRSGVILGDIPEDCEIGKIIFNVKTPFQDLVLSDCKTLSTDLYPYVYATTYGTNSDIDVTTPFYLTPGLTGIISPSEYVIEDNIAERTDKVMTAGFGDSFAYYNITFPYNDTEGKWNFQGRTFLHKYNKVGAGYDWGMKLVNSEINDLGNIYPGDAGVIELDPIILKELDYRIRCVFQMDIPSKTSFMIKTYDSDFDIDTFNHETKQSGQLIFAVRYGQLKYYKDDTDTWTVLQDFDEITTISDTNKHILELVKGPNSGYMVILDGNFVGYASTYNNVNADISNIVICSDNETPYRTMVDHIIVYRMLAPTIPENVMLQHDSIVLKDNNNVLHASSKGDLRTAVFYDTYKYPTGNKVMTCGGWNGTTNLKSIEIFDVGGKTGSRYAAINLVHGRREACTANSESEGKCFIIGGTLSTSLSQAIPCNIIESINSKVNVVSTLYSSEMPNRLKAGAANMENGKTYIVGGYNNTYNFASQNSNIASSIITIDRITGVSTSTSSCTNTQYAGITVSPLWPNDGAFITVGGRGTDNLLSDTINKVSIATLTNSFNFATLLQPLEMVASTPTVMGILIAGGFNTDNEPMLNITKYNATTDTTILMCGVLRNAGGQVAIASDFTKTLGYINGNGACPPKNILPKSGLNVVSIINSTVECSSCLYRTNDNRTGGNLAVI